MGAHSLFKLASLRAPFSRVLGNAELLLYQIMLLFCQGSGFLSAALGAIRDGDSAARGERGFSSGTAELAPSRLQARTLRSRRCCWRVWRQDPLGSAPSRQLSLLFSKRKESAAFTAIMVLPKLLLAHSPVLYYYLPRFLFLSYFVVSGIAGVSAHSAVDNLYITPLKCLDGTCLSYWSGRHRCGVSAGSNFNGVVNVCFSQQSSWFCKDDCSRRLPGVPREGLERVSLL